MKMEKQECYLGDGLYASDDGFMFTLRAPRDREDHVVMLEPEVLSAFLRFIERSRGMKITVHPVAKEEDDAP